MTLEVPSRFLSCPECGSHEFRVSMTTGGYPAQVTLHCLECGCDDERFWASEDWRKLESMETFEAPNIGPALRVKRRGKI